MEITDKKVIKIERKTEPFKCKKCQRMVNPNFAQPKVTETDKYILHGWDYGHAHKRVFEIQIGEEWLQTQFPVSDDY